MTQRASDIAAFVTPGNCLQYTVMAFGIRLMWKVLSGVANCEAYDDVVACSSVWETHRHTRGCVLVF